MEPFVDNLLPLIDNFLLDVKGKAVDWEHRSSPGRWSNKEIIGHLCDSAIVNLQRFIRCSYEENFKLIYHQDAWVAIQHYQDTELDDLLAHWRSLNVQISKVLNQYPPERWQAQCDTGKHTQELHTVEFLAQDYIEHLKHHLNQISI